MDEPCHRFDCIANAVRKKRTLISRRPTANTQSYAESREHSSGTTLSDDTRPGTSEENGDANSQRKNININQSVSRVYASGSQVGKVRISDKEGGRCKSDSGRNGFDRKRSTEGVLAPANWKSTNKTKESVDSGLRSVNKFDGVDGNHQGLGQSGAVLAPSGNENKVKKLKFKVGGITRTVHNDSTSNGVSSNHQLQRYQEKDHSDTDKRTGLQGIPWKSFSRDGPGLGKEYLLSGKNSGSKSSGKQGAKSEVIRKTKRVSKKRMLDEELSEDDAELQYLKKVRFKDIAGLVDDKESNKKQKLSSKEVVSALRIVKDGERNTTSERLSKGSDCDLMSDDGLEKIRNQKKGSVDLPMEGQREMSLTRRQRALQSSKDGSAAASSLIEFPDGLPPAPSKKQKDTLTEDEKQLKKAEAAQRRRMQNEKAAREIEAEAIRKILGQDSNRKKKEDKIKKQQEERKQEMAANSHTIASNTVRWVSGPTGNVVTFSNDIGLPHVLDSKPSSYPPPREKCAGPSCANTYKYRDSKSNLPLCSLRCYKAIQEQTQAASRGQCC